MPAKRQLRAGIIGLGRVASTLEDDPRRAKPCTHAGSYAAHPETRVVAGADIDSEARGAFGERWGVSALYDDYRDMLAAEELDIVSVCAHATERAEMVVAAAEAGVRGIWCEKAIATSLGEARRMVDACAASGAVAIVNHSRRWSPEYREAARRIRADDIGSPEAIVAWWSGHLLHTGTHAFDVMRMLLGEVAEVRGTLEEPAAEVESVSGFDAEDDRVRPDVGGHATLTFASGALGTVHASSKSYFTFRFEVTGTKGAIRLGNDLSAELFQRAESETATGFEVLRGQPLVPRETIAVAPQVEDLVAALRTGSTPASTLEDGARALEIGLAVHESSRRGEAVPLPLDAPHLVVASR